jgi:hypothetical protein
LGKKPLIATSLVVNLPPEHIRCVETLSHKTLANITNPNFNGHIKKEATRKKYGEIEHPPCTECHMWR